jgi:hypothetical protein
MEDQLVAKLVPTQDTAPKQRDSTHTCIPQGVFRNTISDFDQQKAQKALVRRRSGILDVQTKVTNIHFVAACKLGQKYFRFRKIFGYFRDHYTRNS